MLRRILIVCIIFFSGVGLTSAVTMDVSPTSVDPGDTLKITYSDLADGSQFSLLIKGKQDVTPYGTYKMDIKTFVMPISLSEGTISANADNSDQLTLNYLDSEDTTKSITKIGNSEGICTITESQSISAKTYDKMWLNGIVAGGNLVNTELSFIGTKSGPNSGTISFVIDGIDQATLNIICRVDGTIILNEPIYVGGGSANTPTPTATTASTTSSGSTSSGGYTASSASVVSSATAIDTSQPGDSTSESSSGSVSATSESTSSVDRSFTYAGTGASDAIIMYDSSGDVPSGWNIEGQAYALISGGSGISGTVYFEIPESFISSGTTGKLFIAEYVNGQWSMLQSGVSGSTISASISNEGTYALMSTKDTVSGVSQPEQTQKKSAGTPALICFIIIGLAVAISLKLKK